MSKRIVCVDHVQLPVSDLIEATAWYSKILELEVMSEGWLKFSEGPVLMLHYTNKDTKVAWRSDTDFPMPAFMLLSNNIEQLHRVLIENNVFIRMYQDEGFGIVLKFVDPFGNELGAYQPHAR
ncbi:VOC family protein [Paenibacillus guangzhouensis]|uniref:VOC family protein n=1 Tax=Paenibacillus guangzhouensis TaxID=1473112 RepID=UPI00187B1B5B|nr:hypothetical protein [Paenibacillus guangzhouensis]